MSGNSCTMWLGIQNGTAVMENGIVVIKIKLATLSLHLYLGKKQQINLKTES